MSKQKGESGGETGEEPGRHSNWLLPALSALHLPAGEIQERRTETPLEGIPLTLCVCAFMSLPVRVNESKREGD